MNLVTLSCKECNAAAVSFASDFMADAAPTVDEMQQYIDLNFLAKCGVCYTRAWEVYSVKPAASPHGAVDALV